MRARPPILTRRELESFAHPHVGPAPQGSDVPPKSREAGRCDCEAGRCDYISAHAREGLEDLLREVERLDIRSIAVPPLGCGNGGLGG